MTTIVYSKEHGTITYDSRSSDGDVIVSDRCDKMHSLSDGGLIFCSGSVPDIQQVLAQWPKFDFTKNRSFSFCAVLFKDGGVFYITTCTASGDLDIKSEEIAYPYYFIGSGSDFAFSALKLGLTPVESIAFASTCDPFTGGEVRAFHISSGEVTNHGNCYDLAKDIAQMKVF